MTAEVPAQVRAILDSLIQAKHGPAWLQIDGWGNVVQCGGALGDYGYRAAATNTKAELAFDFLAGILPTSGEPIVLDNVNTPGGPLVDVVVQRLEGFEWVVLADNSRDADRQRVVQQLVNETRLRSYGPAKEQDGDLLAEVASGLGTAIFEHRSRARFSPVGRPPEWLEQHLTGFPESEDGFDLVALFPFLDSWITEAEAVWSGEGTGSARSGTWTEHIAGRDVDLEAVAMRLGGFCVAALRNDPGSAEERRRLLQRGRETSLRYAVLARETAEKEVLLHCLVHDLSGPLNSMLGVLNMLSTQPLDEDGRHLLEMGLEQAAHQGKMLREVLEVFAIDVDAIRTFEHDPELAPDLLAVAERVTEGMSAACEERSVTLALQIDEASAGAGDWHVAAEEERLERVLTNLVENALRHSAPGSTVRVLLERDGGHVGFHVDDEGPGVPKDLAEKIFERSTRAGPYSGKAGLGLYFCRLMAERWGGSIEHTARPSGGARFSVALLGA